MSLHRLTVTAFVILFHRWLFFLSDWLWKMPAEAMSEMQRQLHATSECLVRCGMRACEGMKQ